MSGLGWVCQLIHAAYPSWSYLKASLEIFALELFICYLSSASRSSSTLYHWESLNPSRLVKRRQNVEVWIWLITKSDLFQRHCDELIADYTNLELFDRHSLFSWSARRGLVYQFMPVLCKLSQILSVLLSIMVIWRSLLLVLQLWTTLKRRHS
jgi:hypothetical protein